MPFEIPESWEWTTISTFTYDLQYGTSEKSSNEGIVPVLRMGNITRIGSIDYSDLVYSSNIEDIHKYKLEKNDLLFNRTNSSEWVGKTAIFKSKTPTIYAGYLIRIRCIIVCPDYVNFVMNSLYHRDWCNQVKTDAVNQSNINAQKLSNFQIPIPPYSEQLRIVNKAKQLLSTIDILDEKSTDLKMFIDNTKSKILDLAISGKLVPQNSADEPAIELLRKINPNFVPCDNSHYENLPEGWIKSDFKDIFKTISVRDCQIQQREIADKGEYPVISQSSNYIEGYSNRKDKVLEINKPVIVFGDHTRIVKYIDFPFIIGADGVKVIETNVDAKYAYYLLLRTSTTIENKGYSRHFQFLSKHLYIIPPLAEQKRIVNVLTDIYNLLDEISSQLA